MSEWFTKPSVLPTDEQMWGVHAHGDTVHAHGANVQGHTHPEAFESHEAHVRRGLSQEASLVISMARALRDEFSFITADQTQWEKGAQGIISKMRATSGDETIANLHSAVTE